MKDWNVVATSQMGQEQRLLRELADLGDFQGSGFREVLIGRVPDPDACLETLKERWDSQPFLPEILSTLVLCAASFPSPWKTSWSAFMRPSSPFFPTWKARPSMCGSSAGAIKGK